MKAIIILLFFVISFFTIESAHVESKAELIPAIIECEDYWYEIVKDGNGGWLKYEYCGDNLISVTPYYWGD